MGGPGSNRWNDHTKKICVEDCLKLPIQPLIDRWKQGQTKGQVLWKGKREAQIAYYIDPSSLPSTLTLRYKLISKHSTQSIEEKIQLATTSSVNGGQRWWMLCPMLSENGEMCGKRIGKLYLPPKRSRFGCRKCWELSYKSSQCTGSLIFWGRKIYF